MIKIKAQNVSNSPAIAYRDVGNEREHAYRDVGGRAMQEQLPRDAVALLTFRKAEIGNFGPKLIIHDFCRGSKSYQVFGYVQLFFSAGSAYGCHDITNIERYESEIHYEINSSQYRHSWDSRRGKRGPAVGGQFRYPRPHSVR